MIKEAILEEGTKLLCWNTVMGSENDVFTEGNEYKIKAVNLLGYFIVADSGNLVRFDSISEIKNVFMIMEVAA